MLTYLLGPWIMLLPARRALPLAHRLGINANRAAVLSGLAEVFLSILLLAAWYLVFAPHFAAEQAALYTRSHPDNPQEIMYFSYGLSMVVTVVFLTHPVTVSLVFFSLEGLLRGLAALLAEDHVGTLPLVLADWLVGRAHRKAVQIQEGPPRPDIVTRGGEKDRWDLRIESCRARTRWDKLTTIEYEDSLYELAAKFEGSPPRPFIYVLRRIPQGKVVRGIYDYSPDEVLNPDFEKTQTMKV